jgi:Fic family protein
VTRKASVTSINRFLDGSPYLLPEDDLGEEVAAKAVRDMRNVERRVRRLAERLGDIRSGVLHPWSSETNTRLIYESNELEGLGSSFRETYELVQAAADKPTDDVLRHFHLQRSVTAEPKVLDVLGLHAAKRVADELAEEQFLQLRQSDIRNLHQLILGDQWGSGQYKTHHNVIEGTEHRTTDPIYVPAAMGELVDWLNASGTVPATLRATVLHAWLTTIHPFADGNGRLSRLLSNLVLTQAGYPPLIVKNLADRGAYIDALGHSDEAGDLLPLFAVFVKALQRSVVELEDPKFAAAVFRHDLLGTEEPRYREWQLALGAFVTAIAEDAQDAGLSWRTLGGLGPSDYYLLSLGKSEGNGWLGKLQSTDGRTDYLLWLGFTSETTRSRAPHTAGLPAIFLSVRDRRPLAQHPYLPLLDVDGFTVNEIVLVPERGSVLVRKGRQLDEVPVKDATAAAVTAVATAPPEPAAGMR